MGWISKIKEYILESDKGRRVVLAAGLTLMAVLLISCFFGGGEEVSVSAEDMDITQTETALEKRLERLLSEIDGVSEPVVMLTLDSSAESLYATDSSSSRSSSEGGETTQSEQSVVLSGSSREPLQTSSVMPKVRGVAVVCGGAENPAVRERVVNTVAGVLNISTSRIYVTY